MSETRYGSRRPPASSETPTLEPAAACDALVLLAQMVHYTISIDSTCLLLVAKRTAAPFERVSQIRDCFAAIQAVLASVPRSRFNLLVDTRAGPSRNDATFESVMSEERGKLLFGFAKNAALAATAAVRLQIQRYAKIDRRVVFVTDSPAAAFASLGLPLHRF